MKVGRLVELINAWLPRGEARKHRFPIPKCNGVRHDIQPILCREAMVASGKRDGRVGFRSVSVPSGERALLNATLRISRW
jgi:hypothetical protein